MVGFQNKYDVNNNHRSLTTLTPAISQLLENGSRWNIFYFLSRILRYGTEKIPGKLVRQFLHDASISRQTNRQTKIERTSLLDTIAYELFLDNCFSLIQYTDTILLLFYYYYIQIARQLENFWHFGRTSVYTYML